MVATATIPVTVLTGFLGSGKTTLLNRLLKSPGLRDAAVIVNEFGDVGLDHVLVEPGEESVVLLDAGCLCCTIANTLSETLNDLYFRRVKGRVPAFRRVLVETTGLADPAPIVHALMADKSVTAHYRFDGLVAAVDGAFASGQFREHPEARKQAAMADRIVVTKTDLVPAADIDALEAEIRAFNPAAPMVRAARGRADPEHFFNAGLYDGTGKIADVAGWLRDEALRPEADTHASAHGRNRNRHDERIETFAVTLERPVTWAGYAAWTAELRAFPGENLLRIKGLLNVAGQRRPAVVQGVQHLFSAPDTLAAWPGGDRRSRLVFITRDLPRAAIEATLATLHAQEGTMPAARRAAS